VTVLGSQDLLEAAMGEFGIPSHGDLQVQAIWSSLVVYSPLI